jgi:hypothetical protein
VLGSGDWGKAGQQHQVPVLRPTAHRLLPSAYRFLPTAYCLLLTAYCLLLTAYCLLPTAYCQLRTVLPQPLLFSHWLNWLFTIGWKWPNLVC